MEIFELYNQYRDAEKEWEMLEELRESAVVRTENAFKRISELFEDSQNDIYRTIPQSEVLKLYESDPESNVYWIKGADVSFDHPFLKVMDDLKQRHPKLFEEPARIIIEVLVAGNFSKTDQLLNDIKSAKSYFNGQEVYVVVKRDSSIMDSKLKGGVALKLEYESDTDKDEIVLDGVSSNDMARFVRKVISLYVKSKPGISLSRLQYDLRFLHRGSKWAFVESKEKIKALKDNDERVLYTFAEAGVLDNGEEYVVYNQLLRRKHLPLIIEFAKTHSIL